MTTHHGRWGFWSLLVLFAVAPLIAETLDLSYLIGVLTRILILALAASALNLVMGQGAMVSFGHAAYVGIGGYVMAVFSLHAFEGLPLMGGSGSNNALIVWPLAAVAGGIAALLIGSVSLRTGGVYFIMITLAFAQMFFYVFASLQTYGGDDGLSLWWGRNSLFDWDLEDRKTFYYVVFIIFAVWLIGLRRLVASPFGRIIRATRQNETRVAALGIAPYRWKLIAFVLSGAICGLAGALLANLDGFVSPASMHWSRSGELMIMVILGGLGSITGPVIGAAVIVMLHEVLVTYTEHWELFLGMILLACVLYFPGGLVAFGTQKND